MLLKKTWMPILDKVFDQERGLPLWLQPHSMHPCSANDGNDALEICRLVASSVRWFLHPILVQQPLPILPYALRVMTCSEMHLMGSFAGSRWKLTSLGRCSPGRECMAGLKARRKSFWCPVTSPLMRQEAPLSRCQEYQVRCIAWQVF